jgi:hypothetical protein
MTMADEKYLREMAKFDGFHLRRRGSGYSLSGGDLEELRVFESLDGVAAYLNEWKEREYDFYRRFGRGPVTVVYGRKR